MGMMMRMMRARALRMSRKSSRQAGRQAARSRGQAEGVAVRATWHMKIERNNNSNKKGNNNSESRENVATSWKNVCGLCRVFA